MNNYTKRKILGFGIVGLRNAGKEDEQQVCFTIREQFEDLTYEPGPERGAMVFTEFQIVNMLTKMRAAKKRDNVTHVRILCWESCQTEITATEAVKMVNQAKIARDIKEVRDRIGMMQNLKLVARNFAERYNSDENPMPVLKTIALMHSIEPNTLNLATISQMLLEVAKK